MGLAIYRAWNLGAGETEDDAREYRATGFGDAAELAAEDLDDLEDGQSAEFMVEGPGDGRRKVTVDVSVEYVLTARHG